MNEPILEMRGVSKSFFSIKALRDVDLTVYAGEIHALMGENGAQERLPGFSSTSLAAKPPTRSRRRLLEGTKPFQTSLQEATA